MQDIDLEEGIFPLLDEKAWRDFELVGGVNIYRQDSGVPNAYYNILETIITIPAEKRKKKKKELKIKKDLENFKLLVQKTYVNNSLNDITLKIVSLDNDARWRIAKFPYKHFSPNFFQSNLEKKTNREYVVKNSVSPVQVFDLIYDVFDYYLDIEKEKLILFTIYTIGTYFYKLFPTYPYLYLFGATESGKTKTLNIFEKLCFNGVATINLSPSALFRLVEVFGATLCIDESEYLKDAERRSELQSILFSGYKKDSGNVLRVEGDKTKNVRVFHVYSPKIMASINYPNDILLTRCIVVNMKRGTNKEKLNRTPSDDFLEIKDKMYLMLFNKFDELMQVKDMDFSNELLVGREHELWRPLFVIAYWLKLYMPEKANEIDEALNKLLEQDVMIKQSLRVDSDLITIIYCLVSNVKESGFVSVKTIRDFILDEYRDSDVDYKAMIKYWTPERIGRQLSSLGFKKERRAAGVYYYIDLDRVKTLAEAYNVTVQQNNNDISLSGKTYTSYTSYTDENLEWPSS